MNDTPLSDNVDLKCYALRRVNPFLGVMQVVETEHCRASSNNGVYWTIEVLAPLQHQVDATNNNNQQLDYYLYGNWSEVNGFVQFPLAPHLNKHEFESQSQHLIKQLRKQLPKLPFELLDHWELWLFDQQNSIPIALLATSIIKEKLPNPRYWTCNLSADLPSQQQYTHAIQLDQLIKKRAGFKNNKHWIIRQDDGGGIHSENNELYPASLFPDLLITEQWNASEDKQVVEDYIQWVSPSLLTLQNMTRLNRARLEACISQQARTIEQHWRLYPEMVEEKLIKAARVQNRLQRSNKKTV